MLGGIIILVGVLLKAPAWAIVFALIIYLDTEGGDVT